MAYPHEWPPISYKSSAGQRKHIGQRPMLYRWTAPPMVPSSCALLCGFAIGARVSLLWQNSVEREMSASACTRCMHDLTVAVLDCYWVCIMRCLSTFCKAPDTRPVVTARRDGRRDGTPVTRPIETARHDRRCFLAAVVTAVKRLPSVPRPFRWPSWRQPCHTTCRDGRAVVTGRVSGA